MKEHNTEDKCYFCGKEAYYEMVMIKKLRNKVVCNECWKIEKWRVCMSLWEKIKDHFNLI